MTDDAPLFPGYPPFPDLRPVLDRARDALGRPLDAEHRGRILAYAAHPTRDGWTAIAGVILNSGEWTTAWQAVRRVDRDFPATGRVSDAAGQIVTDWARIPSPALLAEAIVRAVG